MLSKFLKRNDVFFYLLYLDIAFYQSFERTNEKAIRALFDFSDLDILRFLYTLPVFRVFNQQFLRNVAYGIDSTICLWLNILFLSKLVVDESQSLNSVVGYLDFEHRLRNDAGVLIEDNGGGSEQLALLCEMIYFLGVGQSSFSEVELPVQQFMVYLLHGVMDMVFGQIQSKSSENSLIKYICDSAYLLLDMEVVQSLDFLGNINPSLKVFVYFLIIIHLIAVSAWCVLACPSMFKKNQTFSDRVEKALKEKGDKAH